MAELSKSRKGNISSNIRSNGNRTSNNNSNKNGINNNRNSGGSDEVNDLDRDGGVWCMQDGRVYEQGEDWEVDSCTSCACQVSVEQMSFMSTIYKI